jgi:type I restriction enzyme S subunit
VREGWHVEPLSKVCQLINRGISPVYLDDGGTAVLNQKCIRDHSINYDLGRRHCVTTKRVLADKLVRVGDVLVNSTGTGTLGRVAQVRDEPHEPTTVDSHVTIVRPKDRLFFPEFFGYALIAIENQIQEGGEGCGGQTELARSKLANDYHVSFPTSIPEQRRIVAILDEAFEGIATAKANAEKNLQNAREVFDSHLNAVFSQRGEGWVEKRLGEMAAVQSGGTPLVSNKSFWGGDIPWYSSGELNKIYTSDPKRYITNDGLNGSNAKLFPAGSLLIGMYDTAALKMSILDRDGSFNQAISGVKENSNIDPLFLLYYVNSRKQSILTQRRGVRQKNLSLSKIKNIIINAPPLNQQRSIVTALSELTGEVQHFESLYQQKLTALNELKQSLLHQAFNGDL